MDSEADAEAAIAKLHNSEFDGAKINVELSHGFVAPPDRIPVGLVILVVIDTAHPGMTATIVLIPSRTVREVRHVYYPEFHVDYDYPPNGAPGRYPDRDFERGRGPFRDAPFSSNYRGPDMEPIPPVDYQRRGSPPRGRYEGRGAAQARPGEFYDSYGGGNYDYSSRGYRDREREKPLTAVGVRIQWETMSYPRSLEGRFRIIEFAEAFFNVPPPGSLVHANR
ncbi:hypothetical protein SprV_0702437700 [Sparganum proliferum]